MQALFAPLSSGDRTLRRWTSTFDSAPATMLTVPLLCGRELQRHVTGIQTSRHDKQQEQSCLAASARRARSSSSLSPTGGSSASQPPSPRPLRRPPRSATSALIPTTGETGSARILALTVQQLAPAGFLSGQLLVYEDNQRARRLYERAGWTHAGDEPTVHPGAAASRSATTNASGRNVIALSGRRRAAT